MMQRNHERAEAACKEALLQMGQGKLLQPRRLLEAALRDDPNHVPTRIALVELAILESDPLRAVREGMRATSIALLRCREAGLSQGEYAGHPTGRLLLKALYVAGRAHLAACDTREAINALAAVLQEDPQDSLGACADLVGIFLDLGKPEGVLGLYRLGFTHEMNLLDVTMAALSMGAYEASFTALTQALESTPAALEVLNNLIYMTEPSDPAALTYLAERRSHWRSGPLVKLMLRRIALHPIVKRTLELVDELDEDATRPFDTDHAETRAQMIANLRSDIVVKSVMERLAE